MIEQKEEKEDPKVQNIKMVYELNTSSKYYDDCNNTRVSALLCRLVILFSKHLSCLFDT